MSAIELAVDAHRGQKRKYNGESYINHPCRVAYEVVRHVDMYEFNVPMMARAAWLHDVLEDCPQITEQQILEATDQGTLDLIKELTNPSKGSMLPRAERKAMDREHLKNASREARIIKLIDRLDNLAELLNDSRTSPDAKRFLCKYADESDLLLSALRGTHEVLEAILSQLIRDCWEAS